MFTKFALLLLAASAPSAFAKGAKYIPGCEQEVRLDAPGGTMEHVSVRDQGDWSVCYSATASEVFDALLLSQGVKPGYHSSMLEGAIQFALAGGKSLKSVFNDDGGEFCDVANQYIAHGSCDHRVMERDKGLSEMLAFLLKSYTVQEKAKTGKAQPHKRTKKENLNSELEGVLKGQQCDLKSAQPMPLAKRREFLLDVLQEMTERTEKEMVPRFEKACEAAPRVKAKVTACMSEDKLSPLDYRETETALANLLTSKRVQPVGIGYCSEVLSSGKSYQGLKPDHKEGSSEADDCGSHESVLIGKRMNPRNGHCEFLIQNSWGSDCDAYADEWSCLNGKVWVDGDALTKNMEDYSRLQ